jgi:hypothetical protein
VRAGRLLTPAVDDLALLGHSTNMLHRLHSQPAGAVSIGTMGVSGHNFQFARNRGRHLERRQIRPIDPHVPVGVLCGVFGSRPWP